MSDQNGERPDPADEGVTEQELEAFMSLGQQLAAQMAEANFRVITSRSGWTMADVEAATERALERMEIGSRDIVVAQGADPDGENWQAIWAAMESRYRQMMTELLRVSGLRVGEKLQ
ncbi:hypothetical protein MKK63_24750 [Methylobacterium sp. J-088]|uniref:hypothetical protein n=1 Tax=Methylobacterium sp. J-088 TaxID=2836664 RepID=UPI001FBB4DA7|nr:hypothetical protein [Methylobacterium sp. J-088]MCJ2065891.1 hypothetical protein [Methylobacterium sp. J-088]